MTGLSLREALQLINASRTGTPYTIGLATGFTPLHLDTFLRAHVLQRRSDLQPRIEGGIYGDLGGTIDLLGKARIEACVAVVEWSDLDPRLGFREAVGASPAEPNDIWDTAQQRLDRLTAGIQAVADQSPVVLALPGLDLPPIYGGRDAQVSPLQARLDSLVAEFAARLVAVRGVRIVASRALCAAAGQSVRDLRSDIRSGFPYSVSYATALAGALVRALLPDPIKKGVITDLDDTLWRGLVGEVGPEGVTWDLDSGSHVHALYQQLLAGLAQRGTLLAAASKNDPDVVHKALDRPDLLVPVEAFYPVAASWNRKSAAVSDILRRWNVSAADVVFVDDNAMELAEVAKTFPEITTLQFPTHDPNAVVETLRRLASLLWPEDVTVEDRQRLTSLRAANDVENARARAGDEASFVRDLAAVITVDSGTGWRQPRSLQLVNKTNQFNLNGRRYDEVRWRELCGQPDSVAWTISYEDRFGALGIVSVLVGAISGGVLTIDCWVLSCRAFSRGIEHHVLKNLCDIYDLREVVLDFADTDRNRVVASLVQRLQPDRVDGPPRLSRRTLSEDKLANLHRMRFDAVDVEGEN